MESGNSDKVQCNLGSHPVAGSGCGGESFLLSCLWLLPDVLAVSKWSVSIDLSEFLVKGPLHSALFLACHRFLPLYRLHIASHHQATLTHLTHTVERSTFQEAVF